MVLTNLIPVPSMQSGWSRSSNTTKKCFENPSIALTGTSSTVEVTVNTTAGIALNKDHTYYARVYAYADSVTVGASLDFYWPIAEPVFKNGISLGAAGSWNLCSGINTRTPFSSANYQLRLDFNNNYKYGVIYYSCPMLIDLTASFGAGKEPTQAWMDARIPFFADTYDFQPLNVPSKISGLWKNSAGVYVKINGVWKNADSVYTKINGVWKQNS